MEFLNAARKMLVSRRKNCVMLAFLTLSMGIVACCTSAMRREMDTRAATFPDDQRENYGLFLRSCNTSCHGVGKVFAGGFADDWEIVVAEMITEHDAPITSAQAQRIIGFLEFNERYVLPVHPPHDDGKSAVGPPQPPKRQ